MFTEYFKREDWEEFNRLFSGAVRWQIARNNKREYEYLARKPKESLNDYELNRMIELSHLYGQEG